MPALAGGEKADGASIIAGGERAVPALWHGRCGASIMAWPRAGASIMAGRCGASIIRAGWCGASIMPGLACAGASIMAGVERAVPALWLTAAVPDGLPMRCQHYGVPLWSALWLDAGVPALWLALRSSIMACRCGASIMAAAAVPALWLAAAGASIMAGRCGASIMAGVELRCQHYGWPLLVPALWHGRGRCQHYGWPLRCQHYGAG